MRKRKFWWAFISPDNSRVHTGIVFTVAGALVGMVAFCFYAFYLQKDIGTNLVVLLTLLVTGGGAVGTLAGRFVPPSGKPPENKGG